MECIDNQKCDKETYVLWIPVEILAMLIFA